METLFRILYVLRFLLYMAAVYLAFHILFARLIKKKDSKFLAFFAIVTHPLTKPVRSFMPPGAPESQVRWATLWVLVALWFVVAYLTVLVGRSIV